MDKNKMGWVRYGETVFTKSFATLCDRDRIRGLTSAYSFAHKGKNLRAWRALLSAGWGFRGSFDMLKSIRTAIGIRD